MNKYVNAAQLFFNSHFLYRTVYMYVTFQRGVQLRNPSWVLSEEGHWAGSQGLEETQCLDAEQNKKNNKSTFKKSQNMFWWQCSFITHLSSLSLYPGHNVSLVVEQRNFQQLRRERKNILTCVVSGHKTPPKQLQHSDDGYHSGDLMLMTKQTSHLFDTQLTGLTKDEWLQWSIWKLHMMVKSRQDWIKTSVTVLRNACGDLLKAGLYVKMFRREIFCPQMTPLT